MTIKWKEQFLNRNLCKLLYLWFCNTLIKFDLSGVFFFEKYLSFHVILEIIIFMIVLHMLLIGEDALCLQASQREDSYEETIRDLTNRLKDVSCY